MSKIKLKEKRLEELKNGSLKKTCKKHGDISIDKIRIDTRGTKICRICSNEQSLKSHNRPEYRANYKKWYHSNPERKKKYANNYKERRKIINRASYHRLKKENPEKFKERYVKQQIIARKGNAKLNTGYIAGLLRTIRRGGRKNKTYEYLGGIKIPKEIIELKREQLKLIRLLRKKNDD